MAQVVEILIGLLGLAGLIAMLVLLAKGTRSPIFRFDAVTSSRRGRYFLVRIVYGLALLLVLASTHEGTFSGYRNGGGTSDLSARFAAEFYLGFSFLQLFAVAILTPAIVAGTVAIERERRTIEYLFATDLSNWEIILGKLVSRLAQLLFFLLLPLPILALATLFGGISGGDLAMAFLIAASTMLVVAAISLCMSVWSRRSRDAVIAAYVVLFALLIAPFFFMSVLQWIGGASGIVSVVSWLNELLLNANPFYLLGNELRFGGTRAWSNFSFMLASHLVTSVTCILAAVWAVRRVHLRSVGAGPKKARRRFALWRPQVGAQPMLWKELVAERSLVRLGIFGKMAVGLIVLAVIVPTLIAFAESFNSFNGPLHFRMTAGAMATVVSCGLLLLIGARAASTVTGEREKDTWLSLISTPLEAPEIVGAKVLGSLYTVRFLSQILVFLWALMIVRDPVCLLRLPLFALVLANLGFFIAGLGVFFSLRCRNSTRAMAATLGIGLSLGGGYLFCCIPLGLAGNGNEELLFSPCMPFLAAAPIMWRADNPSSQDAEILVACLLGNTGYLIAGLALFGVSVGAFENLAGRTFVNSEEPPKSLRRAQTQNTSGRTMGAE